MKLKLLALILLVCQGVSAQSWFQETRTTQGLMGLKVDSTITEGTTAVSFSPRFLFYLDTLEMSPADSRPAALLPFMEKTGYIDLSVNIFSGLSTAEPSNQDNSRSTNLGMAGEVMLVWDYFPVTLSIPLEDNRLEWKVDDNRYAVLHYGVLGLQPGFYIGQNLHVSAGVGYSLPDLFTDLDDDYYYTYTADDILIFRGDLKGVFEIADRFYTGYEAGFTFLSSSDEMNGDVTGWGLNGEVCFFLNKSLGLGAVLGTTSINDIENAGTSYIRVMGASEAGFYGLFDPVSFLQIKVYVSRYTPQEAGYEAAWKAGLDLSARL